MPVAVRPFWPVWVRRHRWWLVIILPVHHVVHHFLVVWRLRFHIHFDRTFTFAKLLYGIFLLLENTERLENVREFTFLRLEYKI